MFFIKDLFKSQLYCVLTTENEPNTEQLEKKKNIYI